MHVSSNMELKGKPVQVRYGPATVKGAFYHICHCLRGGKTIKCDELKSGDLLALEKVISYGVLRKALFLYLKYILRRGSFLLQEGM